MTERQEGRGKIAHRTGARPKSVASSLLCAALLAALPASAATTSAATTAPIEIAIFDFEFEDYSAGASFAGVSPSDTEAAPRR